jgi:hypothetical protein
MATPALEEIQTKRIRVVVRKLSVSFPGTYFGSAATGKVAGPVLGSPVQCEGSTVRTVAALEADNPLATICP